MLPFATRPSASNFTPSEVSSSRFCSTVGADSPQLPLKPPSQRVEATTRCHGTGSAQPVSGLSGLFRMAPPTALAQDDRAVATLPYVATLPAGMVRTSSKQRTWKGVSFLAAFPAAAAIVASSSQRLAATLDGTPRQTAPSGRVVGLCFFAVVIF